VPRRRVKKKREKERPTLKNEGWGTRGVEDKREERKRKISGVKPLLHNAG
jgi:hypothetical protein